MKVSRMIIELELNFTTCKHKQTCHSPTSVAIFQAIKEVEEAKFVCDIFMPESSNYTKKRIVNAVKINNNRQKETALNFLIGECL